ncbi:MAG: Nif3-like dinuclear metal center hexameric protein [Azovibrio sp.]|uniref:Nif3-like dinuclear metal center hexameric protein n=1 Tax=Azovibrio sp. TaxID=1872673 RepID=UPI003C777A7E
MNRDELVRYLDDVLESAKFGDYSPNGLQVEGRAAVFRIVTGVTASQALLDEAVRRGADTVIVHHGYFWKGESPRVTGLRRRRLGTLLQHDINLIAYHLPLDAHPGLGNNARWAQAMGWQPQGRCGDQDLVWWGSMSPAPLEDLARRLEQVLGRVPLVIGEAKRPIRRIAWCSGGAQGYIEAAAALGVDAYLSGEISEQTPHLAREHGMAYLACGHHATERFGVKALAEFLSRETGLACEFVDLANPA